MLPPLESLGDRICVLGPSNAGKSTLACAIGQARSLSVIHLDQLHHLPGTDWVPRPREDFAALHSQAVAGESWVIDGNYRGLLDGRLARATGLILLGSDRWSCLWRYLRRTQNETDRIGGLPAASEKINPWMVWYILAEQPGKMRLLSKSLQRSQLPIVHLPSFAQTKQAHELWQLRAPQTQVT